MTSEEKIRQLAADISRGAQGSTFQPFETEDVLERLRMIIYEMALDIETIYQEIELIKDRDDKDWKEIHE